MEFPDVHIFLDQSIFGANRLTCDNFFGTVNSVVKLSQYPFGGQEIGIACQRPPQSFALRGQLVQGATGGRPAASLSPTNGGMTRQTTMQGDGWKMKEREDKKPPLPPGWEAHQDKYGRTYYFDHANRRTQWERPVVGRVPDISAQRRFEGDRRFQQTMRRQIPTSEMQQQSSPCPVSAVEQKLSTMSLSDDDLPPGLEIRRANDGRPFYLDHNTRTTYWARPENKQNFYNNTHSTQWEDPQVVKQSKQTEGLPRHSHRKMTMKNKDHQLLSYDDGYDTDVREEELDEQDASTDESDTENNLLLCDTAYQSEQSQRGNKVNSSPFAVAPTQSTDIIEATGFVYYMEDEIIFTAATKEQELNLIQYMKKEHPEAVRKTSVYFKFKYDNEDIELKFDVQQMNGWSVNSSVQPCRLRCHDIMNFGRDYLVPPYCWITVDCLPEANKALHYAVPLVNVADSEPPTIFIHIAPKSHLPSANNLPTTRLPTGRARIVDIKIARRKLKEVLTTRHADLSEVFQYSLGSIANELLQVKIITHEVHRSATYDSIIGCFVSVMTFMPTKFDLERHCVKFLKALSKVGEPVALVARQIQTEWTEAVGSQFNFSF